MKKNAIDILIWKNAQEGQTDDSSIKRFEFYFQNQKVGECTIRLCKNAYGIYGDRQFFPENWFCEEKDFFNFPKKSARLKPFLDIGRFDFSEFQGKGFGRMGLQALFELSKNLEADGRISLDAQKQPTSLSEPATFYEHCGFKGNKGESGRKYFNATAESMGLLFSKNLPTDFQMKEVAFKQNENAIIDRRTGQIKVPKVLKEILNNQKN